MQICQLPIKRLTASRISNVFTKAERKMCDYSTSMCVYPTVLLPHRLTQILRAQPPVELPPPPEKPKPLPLPIQPGKKPRPIEWDHIWPGLCISWLLGGGISSTVFLLRFRLGTFLFIGTGLLLVVVIGKHVYRQLFSYERRLKAWQDYRSQYPDLLREIKQRSRGINETYLEKLRLYELDWEKRLEHERSPERVRSYRQELLRNFLNESVVIPDVVCGDGQETKSQSILRRRIESYFAGDIYLNIPLELNTSQYVPIVNLVYVESDSGLCVAIQIDEPYDTLTKEPRHCLGSDELENHTILQKNWVVIRFSEEQVVCHTHSCCKVLARTIADITGNQTQFRQLETVPDPPLMPVWTYKEALSMAKINARQAYSCSA